jgi:hypothetical protein
MRVLLYNNLKDMNHMTCMDTCKFETDHISNFEVVVDAKMLPFISDIIVWFTRIIIIYCGIYFFPLFSTKHKKLTTYIFVDVVIHFGIKNLVKKLIILSMQFTYKKSNCKKKY